MFSKKMFRLIFHESDFSLKLFICKVAVVQQKQKTLLRLREHDFLVFFYDSFAKFWPWSGRFQAPRMLQACERFSISMHNCNCQWTSISCFPRSNPQAWITNTASKSYDVRATAFCANVRSDIAQLSAFVVLMAQFFAFDYFILSLIAPKRKALSEKLYFD